jgi:hypothetical protein
MWSFYIGFDAQNEAYIAENSVKKSKDLRVEIYALEDNQILICTNQNHYPAYFEDRFGKIYYTEDFDLTKDYFLAEKLLCTQDTLELQLLEQKPSFLIRYLPEVFLDPSKPLQIFLIGLIPLLVLKDAFKFSRMTKPLLILAKNSTLFVILNLVGKSLCHLISKII